MKFRTTKCARKQVVAAMAGETRVRSTGTREGGRAWKAGDFSSFFLYRSPRAPLLDHRTIQRDRCLPFARSATLFFARFSRAGSSRQRNDIYLRWYTSASIVPIDRRSRELTIGTRARRPPPSTAAGVKPVPELTGLCLGARDGETRLPGPLRGNLCSGRDETGSRRAKNDREIDRRRSSSIGSTIRATLKRRDFVAVTDAPFSVREPQKRWYLQKKILSSVRVFAS